MKQIINLDNGTRVEIDGNEVKLIGVGDNVLYYTGAFPSNATEIIASHFFLMGESERRKVAKWFYRVNSKIGKEKEKQRDFLDRVQRAIDIINYDYYIAILEPSCDSTGNIFYQKGKQVATGMSFQEWKEKAANFYFKCEWHSELAQLEEGDLFKAYRIAMGYWTMGYVCDDSSRMGNYWNAPNSSSKIKICGEKEVSGAREVGGFSDGIGNTCEIYQANSGFAIVGGNYGNLGYRNPVANVDYVNNCFFASDASSGVLVIKRSTVS